MADEQRTGQNNTNLLLLGQLCQSLQLTSHLSI